MTVPIRIAALAAAALLSATALGAPAAQKGGKKGDAPGGKKAGKKAGGPDGAPAPGAVAAAAGEPFLIDVPPYAVFGSGHPGKAAADFDKPDGVAFTPNGYLLAT